MTGSYYSAHVKREICDFCRQAVKVFIKGNGRICLKCMAEGLSRPPIEWQIEWQ